MADSDSGGGDPGAGQAARGSAGSVLPDGWREVRRVARTGSTNADLAALADAGEPEGLVLLADHQDAGRGRLGRAWSAPPGSGLTVSVLLRPPVPPARLGWLPLLTGLATAEAVRAATGVPALLKWPNDVVVEDGSAVPGSSQSAQRKLGGLLAELRPAPAGHLPAVVVGLGLNLTLTAGELPVPTATSLLLEGAASTDRDQVLEAVLAALLVQYRDWAAAGGDADACGLRAAYTRACTTVGRSVRVDLPGRELHGTAVGIDSEGRLQVRDRLGEDHLVAAGDVVHVRPVHRA